MHHAQPKLKFIPQVFNPLVLKIAQRSLPILLRFRTRPWLTAGITGIEITNLETLVELYSKFQAGKIRFFIAFRHCEVDDPLPLFYLFSRAVPRFARQKGIPLKYPIHSHFLYDRGMTIWGGKWLGWLLSRVGGVPVRRGRALDLNAMRTIRDLSVNGKFPVTVAPEGATNGHSEIVSPLQPGMARLGFWCVEDLLKADRSEEVYIVPIGIKYRYIKPSWKSLDKLLSRLEANIGLRVPPTNNSTIEEPEKVYYQRLFSLGEHLLSQMEEFYTRFYHRQLPQPHLSSSSDRSKNELLAARLQILLDTALQVAEEYFGIQAKGNLVERCRKLEEASWNYIYREDISDLNSLSPFERGLADWVAIEAQLRVQHMRLVETFVAVTGTYVLEKPTIERFAETALLMFDLIARIEGKKYPPRPRIGKRWVEMKVGEPISVTKRWQNHPPNRKGRSQAIKSLTEDLKIALENLI
ncbi:MAG: 1-acyl-sn-glycerol-3-phosphate acyltransferase [Prochloraceae cyanobacterium]|nr:1-acyl-sn-glycerol-3-phosphate acyltransferase [Prochloraceae cyanobacterium]